MGFLRGLTRAAVAGTAAFQGGKKKGLADKAETDERARKVKLEEGREARDVRLDALRESLLGAQTKETEAQTKYYESGAGLRNRTDPNIRSGGSTATLQKDANYQRHFKAAKADGMSDADAANYARVRVGLAPVRSTSGALDAYIRSKTPAGTTTAQK